MKMTDFLNNPIVPGAVGIHQWDSGSRTIKEIILSNSFANTHKVSEAKLNIQKVSAIDELGNEQIVEGFEGQRNLLLPGIQSGRHIYSRSIVKLKPGTYKVLRFYLDDEGGTLTFEDRREMPVQGFNYLDFDIEGSLEITENEPSKIVLRFDFPPFKYFKFFNSLKEYYKRSKKAGSKLAGSTT